MTRHAVFLYICLGCNKRIPKGSRGRDMMKIKLNKETLRTLDAADLADVMGGGITKTKHNTKLTYYSKYPTCDPRKCTEKSTASRGPMQAIHGAFERKTAPEQVNPPHGVRLRPCIGDGIHNMIRTRILMVAKAI